MCQLCTGVLMSIVPWGNNHEDAPRMVNDVGQYQCGRPPSVSFSEEVLETVNAAPI